MCENIELFKISFSNHQQLAFGIQFQQSDDV